MGKRYVLRIARKDIVWNEQNMRWESPSSSLGYVSVRSGSKPKCLANEPIGCAPKPVRNAQAINSRVVGYSEVTQFDGLSPNLRLRADDTP